jgi:hypothetical protein
VKMRQWDNCAEGIQTKQIGLQDKAVMYLYCAAADCYI